MNTVSKMVVKGLGAWVWDLLGVEYFHNGSFTLDP